MLAVQLIITMIPLTCMIRQCDVGDSHSKITTGCDLELCRRTDWEIESLVHTALVLIEDIGWQFEIEKPPSNSNKASLGIVRESLCQMLKWFKTLRSMATLVYQRQIGSSTIEWRTKSG